MNCPSEEQLYELAFEHAGGMPPDLAEHVKSCHACAKAIDAFALLSVSLTALKPKLDRNPPEDVPAGPAAAPPSASPSGPPKRIGNYLILAKLGEGGMGVVYKAYDIETARMVAVKIIRPEVSRDPNYEKRFQAECRVAAQLDHPNIVRMLSQGVDNGRLYYAMDYVRGTSLDHVLAKAGLLESAVAASIMRQVAAGLGEAHRRQLVHRDVKPSNILLEDNLERVRITDFGVVKELDRKTSVTQTGELVGTLTFMSPEQIDGLPITPASDIFSVGVIFYQLLTGKLPFNADTPTALMRKIAMEPHRNLSEFGPLVPPGLQQIIDRCLAKKPQNRYQNGGELERALAQFGNGTFPPAAPAPRSKAHAKWLTATICAVAACLVVAVLVAWQRHKVIPARDSPPLSKTVQVPATQPAPAVSAPGFTLPADLQWKPTGPFLSECLRLGPFSGKHDEKQTAEVLACLKAQPDGGYKGRTLVKTETEGENFDGVPPGHTTYFVCYLRAEQDTNAEIVMSEGAGCYVNGLLDFKPFLSNAAVPFPAGVHCLVVKVMTNGGGGTRIAVTGKGIEQAVAGARWDVLNAIPNDAPAIDAGLLPKGLRWVPVGPLLHESWVLGPFPRDQRDDLVLHRLGTRPNLDPFEGHSLTPAKNRNGSITNAPGQRVYHVFYLNATAPTRGHLSTKQPAGVYTTPYLNGEPIPYCGSIAFRKGLNVFVLSLYSNGNAAISISCEAPGVSVGVPVSPP